MEIHQYPLELMEDRFNNSYIQLTFFDYVIENHNDKNSVLETNLNNPKKTEFGRSKEGEKINLNSASALGSAMLSDGFFQGAIKANNMDLTSKRTAKITGYVKLPLPPVITNVNSISWNDTDMTKIMLLNASTDSIKEAGGSTRYTDIATQFLQLAGKNDNANSGSVMTYAKSALADMTDQTYTGIDKRTLDLEWTFIVTSKKEGIRLKRLVDFIESRSLPASSRSGIGLDNFFLTYPDSINVNFMKNGRNNDYLPKFNDMVITNVRVTYGDSNSNGLYTLEEGEPVSVTLNISLKEKFARIRDTKQATFDY